MPTLDDMVYSAKLRIDRVNAPTPTTSDWYGLVNGSVQELYGILTSTYEDYNVKKFAFSLVGGSEGNNQLALGPRTTVPDFFQPRAVWLQIGGSPTPYVTIPRLSSINERNLYTFPNVVPIYGAIPSAWSLFGSTLEILPPTVSAGSYVLWYVPTMRKLVVGTDDIDSQWLSVNGWDEYVTLDAAAKAAVKEESLEVAAFLIQQKKDMLVRILREAQPRDVSEPGQIVDMNRVRNLWRGGVPGSGAAGWGWGGEGGGNW